MLVLMMAKISGIRMKPLDIMSISFETQIFADKWRVRAISNPSDILSNKHQSLEEEE